MDQVLHKRFPVSGPPRGFSGCWALGTVLQQCGPFEPTNTLSQTCKCGPYVGQIRILKGEVGVSTAGGGGGGGNEAPQNLGGGGGLLEKGSIDRTINQLS